MFVAAAAAFILALSVAAAPPLPRITLFTALPLMWGEGDPADILSGRAKRSAALDGLDVRAIDTVNASTLDTGILVVAQPRAMAPAELVALDSWVRGGGRVAVFADPRLDWPSRFALGDPRRAPPVTLLDPLLAHWGVRLDLGADGAGVWQRGACATVDAITIDCRIGKGRALLIADADVLDVRNGGGAALRRVIDALESNRALDAESLSRWPLMVAGGLATLLILLGLRTYRSRT